MWLGAGVADAGNPSAGGGRVHRIYTVVVFIVLAALDNVTIGLVPPLISPISDTLHVAEGVISGVTLGVTYLVSAIAAVGWAYFGDRNNRKPLLMIGTLIWAAGTLATALANVYLAFLAAQVVAAIGLGAVASVGFSVVTDLIAPRRRGVVMAFWGLSQGVGTLAGVSIGGLLGSTDWRRPFYLLTIVGVAATFAYLFTLNIRRGASEPQLAATVAAGEYEYRISRADLPRILRRRTNLWLVLQGFTAQLVFGSLVLLPRLFQAKAEDIGYSQSTAIEIGSLYATLFQLGGVLSIVGGLIGDRLQRRTPRGRALVAAVGILAAIPFYVVLFFVPIRLDLADGAGSGAVVGAVLASVVTEPVMAVSFLAALLALALTSANSPNWYALIADVNPPEHRGTVFSLGNLVNGAGRSVGTGLVSISFRALERALPPPLNFAAGLAAFQVFFIPTGIMYWLASRSSPRDIQAVREMLDDRGRGDTTAATTSQKSWPPGGGQGTTSEKLS